MRRPDGDALVRLKRTFRQRLVAAGSLGEELLALRNGLATEADTLLRVENGTLPDERLDATSATVNLVQSDLVDDLGAMLPIIRIISANLLYCRVVE